MLGDSEGLAEAFAHGAGAVGIVEIEHFVARFEERNAVGLEAPREVVAADRAVGVEYQQGGASVGLVEGGFGRFGKARQFVAVVRHGQTVDEHVESACRGHFGHRQGVGEVDKGIVDDQTGEAFLCQDVELSGGVASLWNRNGGDDGNPGAFGTGGGGGHNVFLGVLSHPFAADGRYRVAYAGEEQAQVVVYFGRRSDGRPRVACVYFLFDCHGRRQSADKVTFGLYHLSHELAGVGRKALDIAAAAFGIQRIEGQRRFARAGKAGDDDKFAARQSDVDIAKVVDPRTFDNYVLFYHIIQSYEKNRSYAHSRMRRVT